MSKKKTILLAFTMLTVFSFGQIINVKAGYTVTVGTEWTLSITEGTVSYSANIRVTGVNATAVVGDLRSDKPDEAQERSDVALGASFIASEAQLAAQAGLGTEEEKTYGGRTLTCYVIMVGDYLNAVAKDSGIFCEQNTAGLSWVLTSWSYDNLIPGYELPLFLVFTALSSIGIIYVIARKKQ